MKSSAHLLGERGDEHALVVVDAPAGLVHQVVDLVTRRSHLDLGIDDAGRTHDLLDDEGRPAPFEVARRRRDEHHLRGHREELLERLRAVVERAGQAEAVVDERLLARAVALVHAADLRHGLVRLVDEAHEVAGEVVEQAVRPFARLAAVEDTRVVLDARAEAHLAQHLHVVLRALSQPVGLEQLAGRLELGATLLQLLADLRDGTLDRALLDVVVRGRPDRDMLEVVGDQLAGERVEVLQAFDLVPEHQRAEGRLGVRGEDLQRFAADAERAAREHLVVARVLDRDELAQQSVAVDQLAAAQDLHVELVGLRRPQTEDARHRGDHDHVAPREHGGRGRVAQAVDLLVDRRVLLDVQVARGDICLGLVVVVVGDEVLDRVVGEERAELVAELGGERLVVGDHERRPLDRLDYAGHRHGLAGAGGAEQGDEALALGEPLGDRLDRRRLIGGRGEDGVELERRHGDPR